MRRFVLHYEGQRFALLDGETVIGRGIECHIRFNDPAVSREHLRILVHLGRAVVVNLSPNGSLMNGERLARARPLADGDTLRLGHRSMSVEASLDAGDSAEGPEDPTVPEFLWPAAEPEPAAAPPRDRLVTPRTMEALERPECPRCRALVPSSAGHCQQCGYSWPHGRPRHATQQIQIDKIAGRKLDRVSFELPLIYCSATLTINSWARDLSQGGVFLPADRFDPVGTSCEITLLSDGHQAVQFCGAVAHVRASPGSAWGGAGVGVSFSDATERARTWLERTLSQYRRTAG